MHNIARLHYITQDKVANLTHAQLAERACLGGAGWVQLRVKKKEYTEWKEIALEVQNVCRKYNALLIINDNVRLASEIDADGVHLGKTDPDPDEARKILRAGKIVGGTANTYEDIEKLAGKKVDYIGLGPFRFTTTKENLSPILGLEGYTKVIDRCRGCGMNIPIIAIGGIVLDDIAPIIQTGIHGVAISSVINLAENPAEMLNKFKLEISKHTKEA